MALTPIDVQQKTFGTALRGYDLDEVDDFLDEVVTSLKGYEQRLAEAQERISGLEAELAGKGDSESAISRALVAAQRSADMIVEEAKADADRILTDARKQSEMLAALREEERAKLDVEVAGMRSAVSELREKMRTLAVSVESDLDQMDRAVAGAEGELAATDSTPVIASAMGVATGFEEPAAEADVDSPVDTGWEAVALDGPEAMSPAEVVVEEAAVEPEPTPEPESESTAESEMTPDSTTEAAQVPETSPPSWEASAATQPRPSVVQWASSWSDDLEVEAATPVRDPLEEALAEANFVEAAPDEATEDAEATDLDPAENLAAAVPTADAMHSDESEPGDAWERAGLEGWAEDTDDEDDRPRRPWE